MGNDIDNNRKIESTGKDISREESRETAAPKPR
jgi:hypothetical protein